MNSKNTNTKTNKDTNTNILPHNVMDQVREIKNKNTKTKTNKDTNKTTSPTPSWTR